MAYHISSAAWADFVAKLKYKAETSGAILLQIDRFFPSTQMCCVCGAKTGPVGLSGLGEREWVCSECGAKLVRDRNAAVSALLEGLRVLTKSTEGAESEFWLSVFRNLQDSLSCEFGQSLDCVTVGTTGLAWVEASDACGCSVASDLGVYTDTRAVCSCVGEPGVSRKSFAELDDFNSC